MHAAGVVVAQYAAPITGVLTRHRSCASRLAGAPSSRVHLSARGRLLHILDLLCPLPTCSARRCRGGGHAAQAVQPAGAGCGEHAARLAHCRRAGHLVPVGTEGTAACPGLPTLWRRASPCSSAQLFLPPSWACSLRMCCVPNPKARPQAFPWKPFLLALLPRPCSPSCPLNVMCCNPSIHHLQAQPLRT